MIGINVIRQPVLLLSVAAAACLLPTFSAWVPPSSLSPPTSSLLLVRGRIGRCHHRRPTSFSSSSKLFLAPQQLGSFEVLDTAIAGRKKERRVVLEDYSAAAASYSSGEQNGKGIPFETAWDWQKECLDQHVQRLQILQPNRNKNSERDNFSPAIPLGPFLPLGSSPSSSPSSNSTDDDKNSDILGLDTVFLLQHSPVYTLGTGSDEKFVLHNENVPTIRMDRGGEVTYHGPGQLTIYPIFDLRSYCQDIHWYMRALEEVILRAISKVPGFSTGSAIRQHDTTGIWMDNYKVAAVGIKCRKWITMHGVAVNVEHVSLEHFDGIVPCGLEGRKVGCLNQFLEAKGVPPITVEEFSAYMVEALEEVFCIELVRSKRNRYVQQ